MKKILLFLSLISLCLSETERQKRVSVNFDGEDDAQHRLKSDSRNAGGITNGKQFKFPIVLPPYVEGGLDPSVKNEKHGTCLIYLESLSVAVINLNNKEQSSATAKINGGGQKNTYTFGDESINCISTTSADKDDKKPKEFWFRVDLDIVEPAKAKKAKSEDALFSVSGPLSLLLNFDVKSGANWYLKTIQVDKLTVKKGSWLTKDLSIKPGNVSTAARANIYGFNDYSFACSNTGTVFFKALEDNSYSIGISFGNIQIQPWTAKNKDAKNVRFGSNVNDCVGTFSIGSWMGIVIALILLAVLSFGYLMLNSVQTMDRFDDPKQKQLIINAKE